MATFGFLDTGLIANIQSKVNKMPNTWSVSAFPPNCSAEYGSNLTVDKLQTFVVKLRDFQKEEALKNNDLDEVLEKIDVKVIVKYSSGKYLFYALFYIFGGVFKCYRGRLAFRRNINILISDLRLHYIRLKICKQKSNTCTCTDLALYPQDLCLMSFKIKNTTFS